MVLNFIFIFIFIFSVLMFQTMKNFSPIKTPQIFLNFRGAELRNSFVSHLIDALERHKINVFVDIYEQRGKDLSNLFVRIEQSQIALAILSPRYSESSWCMDELVKMMKLGEQKKLRVIPIFYKVRAVDVSEQMGEFGEKFDKLETASTEDQSKEWKEALKCICNKMGMSSKDASSDADFVKKIVEAVQEVVEAIRVEEERKSFRRFFGALCFSWLCISLYSRLC